MLLKRLTIYNYGPFALPVSLDVDPQVTILTGQNDTGKSSVLRLIQLLCGPRAAKEDDGNVDHIVDSSTDWTRNEEIYCIATFVAGTNSQSYVGQDVLQYGSEFDIKYELAPARGRSWPVLEAREPNGGRANFTGAAAKRMPRVLSLPLDDEISSTIDVTSLSPLERRFLALAFGNNAAKLSNLSPGLLRQEIARGADRLNARLAAILPPSIGLQFTFYVIGSDPLKLSVHLRDTHGGETYLHLRGTGLRKILALLVELLDLNSIEEHVLILFDEPETSLHADTQHLLRTFLEDLATQETIQVIYATHSPSMINNIKIDGIRLLERTSREGKPTSIVHNRPIEHNFQPIRVSLGISPADSLLYAPITLIVEGETEIKGLSFLLHRLLKEQVEGFEQLDRLLSQVHFIDGQGDSFEYWCRLTKSQGSKPIIFLDGDKARQVRQLNLNERHPDVPLILLPEGTDFEEIVPRDCYFQALAEVTGENTSYEAFAAWEKDANLHEQTVFTRRVAKWLAEVFPNAKWDKPTVMRRALELADVSHITLNGVRNIVAAMKTLLGM